MSTLVTCWPPTFVVPRPVATKHQLHPLVLASAASILYRLSKLDAASPACEQLLLLVAEWLIVWGGLGPADTFSPATAVDLLLEPEKPVGVAPLAPSALLPAALVLFGRALGEGGNPNESPWSSKLLPSALGLALFGKGMAACTSTNDTAKLLYRAAATLARCADVLATALVLAKPGGSKQELVLATLERALGVEEGGTGLVAPLPQVPEKVTFAGTVSPVDPSRAGAAAGLSSGVAYALYQPDVPAPLLRLVLNATVEGALLGVGKPPSSFAAYKLVMKVWKALPHLAQEDVSAAFQAAVCLKFGEAASAAPAAAPAAPAVEPSVAPAAPTPKELAVLKETAATATEDTASSLTAALKSQAHAIYIGRLFSSGGHGLTLPVPLSEWDRRFQSVLPILMAFFHRVKLVEGKEGSGQLLLYDGATCRATLASRGDSTSRRTRGGSVVTQYLCSPAGAVTAADSVSSPISTTSLRMALYVRKELLLYGAGLNPLVGEALATMLGFQDPEVAPWAASFKQQLASRSLAKAGSWPPVVCITLSLEDRTALDWLAELDDALLAGSSPDSDTLGVVQTRAGDFFAVETLPSGPDRSCVARHQLVPLWKKGRASAAVEWVPLSKRRHIAVEDIVGTSAPPLRGICLSVVDLCLVVNAGNKAVQNALLRVADVVDPAGLVRLLPREVAHQASLDQVEILKQLGKLGDRATLQTKTYFGGGGSAAAAATAAAAAET